MSIKQITLVVEENTNEINESMQQLERKGSLIKSEAIYFVGVDDEFCRVIYVEKCDLKKLRIKYTENTENEHVIKVGLKITCPCENERESIQFLEEQRLVKDGKIFVDPRKEGFQDLDFGYYDMAGFKLINSGYTLEVRLAGKKF